jgi:hypothetical protein
MALTIERWREAKPVDHAPVIAEKDLYINAAQTKIVPIDSPEAAFLLAAKGHAVDPVMARKLGLVKQADSVEDKAVAQVANKAKKKGKE